MTIRPPWIGPDDTLNTNVIVGSGPFRINTFGEAKAPNPTPHSTAPVQATPVDWSKVKPGAKVLVPHQSNPLLFIGARSNGDVVVESSDHQGVLAYHPGSVRLAPQEHTVWLIWPTTHNAFYFVKEEAAQAYIRNMNSNAKAIPVTFTVEQSS